MSETFLYLLEPEMSCDFSDAQVWAPDSADPRGVSAVRPLHLEFDVDAHGCLIRCTPHYGATPELIEAWREAGITGFRTAFMTSIPSPPTRDAAPEYQPPNYLELIVAENPTDDLYNLPFRRQIRASRRAAEIYAQFDPGLGGVLLGTHDDPEGDSLSPQVVDEVLRSLDGYAPYDS